MAVHHVLGEHAQACMYSSSHFYDLLTTMKRCNHHIVLLGNSVCITNLPDLHKQASLHISPDPFIYPGELTTYLTFAGC